MQQFFVSPDAISGTEINITGEEAHHLAKVLRLAAGDKIAVADGCGNRFLAQLEQVTTQRAQARVDKQLPAGEAPVEVILLQGVPKSDKLDLIVQKATELGIAKIIPVQLKRCVSQIKPAKAAAKAERWQRIAREAAKQCNRARVPNVTQPMSLAAALGEMPMNTLMVVPWEDENNRPIGEVLSQAGRPEAVAYLIGPEGGVTADEVECIRRYGGSSVTLGPRILRTETAAIAALTIIMHQLGDLGGAAGG